MRMSIAGLIALIWFIYNFILGVVIIFLPIYLSSLGMNGTEIGCLMAAFSFVAILTSTPSGFLSDRFVSKRAVLTGLFMVFLFLMGVSTLGPFGPLILLPVFLVGGTGDNLFWVSLEATLYKCLGRMGKGTTIGRIHFARAFGWALSALVGGVLVASLGFSSISIMMAAGVILLTIGSLNLPKTSVIVFGRAPHRAYAELMRKDVLIFLFVMLLLAFHFGAERTVLSLYAKNEAGLGDALIGLFYFLTIMVYAFVGLMAGRTFDRVEGYGCMVVVGLFLSGLGNILTGLSGDFITLFLSRTLHEVGDAVSLSFASFAIARTFPKERVGGMTGLFNTIFIAGSALGSLGCGIVVDILNLSAPFFIVGFLSILGSLIVLTLSTKLNRFLKKG